MLWFEYKKETNIFCVATFSVALLNIVLNIFFWTGILTIQENYFRIHDYIMDMWLYAIV